MNGWEKASIVATIAMLVIVGCAVARTPDARQIAAAQRAVATEGATATTPCPTLYRLAGDRRDSLYVATVRQDCTLP